MIELSMWLYRERGVVRVYDRETPQCERVDFTLTPFDYMSWSQMEQLCTRSVQLYKSTVSYLDRTLMTLWMMRHHLRSWSFDTPLSFTRDGLLDDKSLERVMRLPCGVVRRLCNALREDDLTEEEYNDIARQSALLFGKAGYVENAHPVLSLYVTLTDMWQKFGLNYFDLQRLPVSLRNSLKRIMGLESQMRASAAQSDVKIDEDVKHRLGM